MPVFDFSNATTEKKDPESTLSQITPYSRVFWNLTREM